jgi:hypothetical protein
MAVIAGAIFIAMAGDAADSGIPAAFGRFTPFLKRVAENQVHGSLRVSGA